MLLPRSNIYVLACVLHCALTLLVFSYSVMSRILPLQYSLQLQIDKPSHTCCSLMVALQGITNRLDYSPSRVYWGGRGYRKAESRCRAGRDEIETSGLLGRRVGSLYTCVRGPLELLYSTRIPRSPCAD